METKDKLYKVLRTALTSNRTPTLRELQARTGRDIPALREALKDLHAEGLVEWEPGGGLDTIRITKAKPAASAQKTDEGGMRYFTEH